MSRSTALALHRLSRSLAQQFMTAGWRTASSDHSDIASDIVERDSAILANRGSRSGSSRDSTFSGAPVRRPATGPAIAGSVAQIDIVNSQRMAMHAMGARSQSAHKPISANKIKSVGYDFEVEWIDAGSITAQVVKFQSLGNDATVILKSEPMGGDVSAAIPESTITMCFSTCPFPAFKEVIDFSHDYSSPESISRAHSGNLSTFRGI